MEFPSHAPPGRLSVGSGIGRTWYPDPSTLKMAVDPRPSGVGAKSRKRVASGDRMAASNTGRMGISAVSPASMRYRSAMSAPGRNRLNTTAWRSGDTAGTVDRIRNRRAPRCDCRSQRHRQAQHQIPSPGCNSVDMDELQIGCRVHRDLLSWSRSGSSSLAARASGRAPEQRTRDRGTPPCLDGNACEDDA